jgi:excisionase family DNA binding protein
MDYVTVAQAASQIGVSPRAIRQRIERGELKAEQVNPRLLMIPKSEIERWRGIGRLKPGPKVGSKRSKRSVEGDADERG